MRPGKHRIDDAQTRVRADAPIGDTFAGTAPGMHQGANDGRPHGHDAAASCFCATNGCRGAHRNAIRLVERQAGVERGIAGRRDACREGDGGELHATAT